MVLPITFSKGFLPFFQRSRHTVGCSGEYFVDCVLQVKKKMKSPGCFVPRANVCMKILGQLSVHCSSLQQKYLSFATGQQSYEIIHLNFVKMDYFIAFLKRKRHIYHYIFLIPNWKFHKGSHELSPYSYARFIPFC